MKCSLGELCIYYWHVYFEQQRNVKHIFTPFLFYFLLMGHTTFVSLWERNQSLTVTVCIVFNLTLWFVFPLGINVSIGTVQHRRIFECTADCIHDKEWPWTHHKNMQVEIREILQGSRFCFHVSVFSHFPPSLFLQTSRLINAHKTAARGTGFHYITRISLVWMNEGSRWNKGDTGIQTNRRSLNRSQKGSRWYRWQRRQNSGHILPSLHIDWIVNFISFFSGHFLSSLYNTAAYNVFRPRICVAA